MLPDIFLAKKKRRVSDAQRRTRNQKDREIIPGYNTENVPTGNPRRKKNCTSLKSTSSKKPLALAGRYYIPFSRIKRSLSISDCDL